MKKLFLAVCCFMFSYSILAENNTINSVEIYSKNDIVYSIDMSELDSINFVRNSSPIQTTTKPTHEGHEYVDMGLSVKWATCNVGGTKPGDGGDAFWWGATEPNQSCIEIRNTILPLGNDAAHVNWGGNWRMPTKEEFEELLENCDVENVTEKNSNNRNVVGYMFTSRINGNCIFFPNSVCRGLGLLDETFTYHYRFNYFITRFTYFSSTSKHISNEYIDTYAPFGMSVVDFSIFMNSMSQCEMTGNIRPVLP